MSCDTLDAPCGGGPRRRGRSAGRRGGARWRPHLGRTALWLVGVGLASAAPARAARCERAPRYALQNGVEVVLLPDSTLPRVALVASLHAGFRDDPPGYAGLAHFVEHLTFRDAPSFASVFELYAQAGATGVNATTSADATDFYAVLPAAQLERGLWVEARRLAIGLDLLDERSARDEHAVLMRELALRYGYAPGFRLQAATYETLFPAPHPYHDLFPSQPSLERLTLDAARRFHAVHYRPDQLRLVLVGDFEPLAASALIERHFGDLAPRASAAGPPASAQAVAPNACTRWALHPPTPTARRIVLRSQLRNERLEFYWPVRPDESPEQWRGLFRLLDSSLGDAARQLGLASHVEGKLVGLELMSFWLLSIDVVPGQSLALVEPLVRQQIEKLAGSAPDADELQAQSEAAELRQALDDTRLLAKARTLARRTCRQATCVDAPSALAPDMLAGLRRFDPSRALIVERRFDPRAADDGEIERLP